ncbi:hypothetical protein RND81_03G070500 [Saponaria officinalis]|uniref:DUF7769 domain-containing protein n=1 Tax=Saponaria officinalis TaxID=3572 RepID=A0AAW1M4F2_SAPOF
MYLLEKSGNRKLPRGVITETAARYNVKNRSISNIWRLAKKQRLVGEALDVKSGRMGSKNKKKILPNVDHIKLLDYSLRDTIERVALNTGVSVGLVHSWVKNGLLKPHSSPLHPKLSELNMEQRLLYSLKSLVVKQEHEELFDLNNLPVTEIMFNEMSNTIHMDEKWFYITQDNQKIYIVDGEELPYRSCQSKRYIIKVMFMCAVSRPIYDAEGELIFDGKIGMSPFTKQQPAIRGSRNRPRGTLETKPIEYINKQVIKKCLIEQVIPAIKSVWPEGLSKHIYIQQDNAKPHIQNNDLDFMAATNSDGFHIQLVFQPPNSPDLNCNDLGYFRALQSLQSKKAAKTVDELVNEVMQAFTDYSPSKLNNIFLSLQAVMVEIMKCKGHNNFSLPHMGKGHLATIGMLPRNLMVNEDLVRECVDYMQGKGKTEGLEYLMNELGYNEEA